MTGGKDVIIGKIVSTFGIKGEVKIYPATDYPEKLNRLKVVCLNLSDGKKLELKVENIRLHKGLVLAKFEGIDSINDAEKLKDADVIIPVEERVKLPSGQFYVEDIIGMTVQTTTGESLGTVKEVLRSPANDIYVTDMAMIPAVKEYIVNVDTENNIITVKYLEGMKISEE